MVTNSGDVNKPLAVANVGEGIILWLPMLGDGNNSSATNVGDVNKPFTALVNIGAGNNSSAVANSGDLNKPLDELANVGDGNNSLVAAIAIRN